MMGVGGGLDAILNWSTTGSMEAMALVLLRATMLLSVTLAVGWGLRRGAARTRHLLWTAAFVLLLGLPAAAVWLPTVELPLLPEMQERQPVPAAVVPGPAIVVGPFEGAPRVDPSGIPSLPVDGFPGAAPQVVDAATPAARAVQRVQPGLDVGLGTALLALWALGVLAGLSSLGVGAVRFRRLVDEASPIEDPSIQARAQAIQTRLGIRDEVRLLSSLEAATPMAGGVSRPVVVLPASASQWSEDRLDVVLTHELVHVLRHDTLRHMVGCVALAVYWFHPLSWVASRMAMNSREQACDEEVVALGTRPSDYARHLLELVEGQKVAPMTLSLPMIQPSQLERRVMSILASNQKARNSLVTSLILLLFCAFGVTAAVAIPVALQTAPPAPLVPTAEAPAALPTPVVAPTPELPPAPPVATSGPSAPAPLFQDAPTCRLDGLSGSFSGTMSTRGGRAEHAGWHNGDRAIQKYIDGLRLCYRIRGEVVLADDGIGVRAVGNDSWVVLEAEGDQLQRMIIVEGPTGLEYDWSVDGNERPYDGEAREWHDRMFSVLGAYWEASTVRGEESKLRGQISSMRGHVSSLKGQISSHRGHVSSLKGQISSHRGHVSSLNGQISSTRGRVSSMKGQISSIRGQMSSLRSAARVTENDETRDGLSGELEAYQAQIDEIQSQIEVFDLEGRVEGIQGQVEAYDLEARTRAIQEEIVTYELEAKVQAIQEEIEAYGLDERIDQKEREIQALDAEQRAAEIEATVEREVDALLRLIRGL